MSKYGSRVTGREPLATGHWSLLRLLLVLAFVLPAVYWFYLACVCQMTIVHDAAGYEALGRLIHDSGWIAYFKSGPHREPLYPLLISLSMALAGPLSVSYQIVQYGLQISLLMISQWLCFFILTKLKVDRRIVIPALFYFGLSPAMVNSALSLFSEIAAYPFVLGIVLMSFSLGDWEASSVFKMAGLGLSTGILCFLLTAVKGAYEFICGFMAVLFLAGVLIQWVKGQRQKAFKLGIFMLSACVLFQSLVLTYKFLNKKYNGQFVFTDRGAWVMYGGFARRTQKLDRRQWLAAAAQIPGIEYCHRLLGMEACAIWGFRSLHDLADEKRNEMQKARAQNLDQGLASAAGKKILERPWQSSVLLAGDFLKMFFWESTRIGFVVYPDGLDRLFDFFPAKVLLEFLSALLSLAAFVFLGRFLWRRRHDVFSLSSDLLPLSFLFVLIGSHQMLYALCSAVDKRHALPIAPLLIIAAAFMIHHFRQEAKSEKS